MIPLFPLSFMYTFKTYFSSLCWENVMAIDFFYPTCTP